MKKKATSTRIDVQGTVFLGVCDQLNNPGGFKTPEFEGIRNEAKMPHL